MSEFGLEATELLVEKDGVCLGTDFHTYTETEKKGDRLKREAKAIGMCAVCPVRQECLERAVRTNSKGYIWAGYSGTPLSRIVDNALKLDFDDRKNYLQDLTSQEVINKKLVDAHLDLAKHNNKSKKKNRRRTLQG